MRELPRGWVWTTLGDLGQTGLFTDGDWVESKDQDPSGVNRLIQLADLGIGTFKDKSNRWMNDEAFERLNCTTLRTNDILIARMPDPLGRACLFPNLPYRSATVVDVAALRPDAELLNPRWLMWIINTDIVSTQIANFATGTTRQRISRKNLALVRVPLPPFPEQHRIVEALEDHLSRLDAAERILASADQRVRSLADICIDDAVLGRSLATPLTSRPSTVLRGKYNRIDCQSLPPLPESWEWRLSESICRSINSGSTPRADLMQQGHGEVPFLKVYNIDPAGYIDFSKNPTFVSEATHRSQLRRSSAHPGDVVTNIVGPPLGKSAVIPTSHNEWNHNQAIVSFRAGSEVEPGWLAACLRSPFIVGLLTRTARATAGQFNIALSTCRELPLPVPPISIQRDLLEAMSETHDALKRTRSDIAQAQSRSTALRRSLLRAAFNGELVDQDPDDEPASVALAQIREQPKPARNRSKRRADSTKA